MSQIEIVEIIEQIKQEIEVDADGHGKASIRATARLAGVSDMAIIKALESANLEPSKLSKILMDYGFDATNQKQWRTNGIPDTAIAIILEYYAFDAGRYCTQQARLVCRAFNAIGIRAWMQNVKGWVKPVVVERALPSNRKLLEALAESVEKADFLEAEVVVLEAEVRVLEADVRVLEADAEVLEPKAKAMDAFISTVGLTNIGEFAKAMAIKGLGRNNMFAQLKDWKLLTKDNEPYQNYVDQGLFVVKPSGSYYRYDVLVKTYRTFITPKGVGYLVRRLIKES